VVGLDWELPDRPDAGTLEDAAWQEGERLSFEDAVAYALEADAPD
jgi:hypothetical protein